MPGYEDLFGSYLRPASPIRFTPEDLYNYSPPPVIDRLASPRKGTEQTFVTVVIERDGKRPVYARTSLGGVLGNSVAAITSAVGVASDAVIERVLDKGLG
jgi:hypothetical protein